MNAQDILKKYGIWIAAGGAALYLVYRYQGGAGAVAPRQSIIPGSSVGSAAQTGLSAEQLRLEAERLKQETQLEIERQRLEAQLEAERLRQQGQQFNLEQQAAAQQRALSTTERGQTFGLIGGIISGIAGIFGTRTTGPVSTPPTIPRSTPPINPGIISAIPTPKININPPLIPAWPEPVIPPLSVTDWGERPALNDIGTSIDSGLTFADQMSGIIEGSVFDDWEFGREFGGGGGVESKLPELIGELEEVDYSGNPREVSYDG